MELFWIWLILGFGLIAAELLSGTFVILFFGIGAILTSALAFFNFGNSAVQITFFAVVSTLSLLLFRKRFIKTQTPQEIQKSLSADIDNTVILSDPIPGFGEAMIAYQGTHWTAVNLEPLQIDAGTRVKIERTEGIKIFVRKG